MAPRSRTKAIILTPALTMYEICTKHWRSERLILTFYYFWIYNKYYFWPTFNFSAFSPSARCCSLSFAVTFFDLGFHEWVLLESKTNARIILMNFRLTRSLTSPFSPSNPARRIAKLIKTYYTRPFTDEHTLL